MEIEPGPFKKISSRLTIQKNAINVGKDSNPMDGMGIPEPKNGSCHPGGDEPASWMVGGRSNLLLMVQKSQGQPPVGCIKPCK